MIYEGSAIQVSAPVEGVATLTFDNKNESVNKFDKATVEDFAASIDALMHADGIKGLVVASAKKTGFIVGADITEFGSNFAMGEAGIKDWLLQINQIFNRFEDLPFPTVAAISGVALGGGFEMCLVCDYRVMADSAQVGLPETQLGIFPGFGGSVRLPRVIGIDNAVEWIATGKSHRADAALKVHAVDAVVALDHLEAAAKDLVKNAIDGNFDWQDKRREKLEPVLLKPIEQAMAFNTGKAAVFAKANPKNYPSIALALDAIEKHVNLPRNEALDVEATNFAKAAVTPQAEALIGVFLSDQLVKKKAKAWTKQAGDLNESAVLGAGIMGGGIAYQAASKGVPIIMKDINSGALDLGMGEATKLLTKAIDRGHSTPKKMGETLARIKPTLNYGDFGEVDIVIEAVVENAKIKKSVLKEVEGLTKDDAILASNTSTISITELATALDRPENFVGMHFFNPVHRMPLVEVIRGEKSSDHAIASTVQLAQKMGKTPIVVGDCAGFLVNRTLFPYFAAFELLMRDGADLRQVDKVMEKFGWPMGPAYLLDVVGMDTNVHAGEVIAEAYPDRAAKDYKGVIELMYEHKRLGQKNGKGFYKYEADRRGRVQKQVDEEAMNLIAEHTGKQPEQMDAGEIEARLMLAYCNETVRCLEDKIVESPSEADMAMLMGLGFPPFRGGPCRYIDQMGISNYKALCEKYAHLGKAYEAPQMILDMAAANQKFYA